MPSTFKGDTYGELVGYLLSKCIVPIGLYRGVNPVLLVGMQENTQPFVSTNPPPDTVIDAHLDKVFVLNREEEMDGTFNHK